MAIFATCSFNETLRTCQADGAPIWMFPTMLPKVDSPCHQITYQSFSYQVQRQQTHNQEDALSHCPSVWAYSMLCPYPQPAKHKKMKRVNTTAQTWVMRQIILTYRKLVINSENPRTIIPTGTTSGSLTWVQRF